MEAASNFLNYDIDYLSFKYPGVKVGYSPRKVLMWKDLINQLKSKLAMWKGRYHNMTGHVLLINSVLNAIPIYSLSFYKAPSKVIKKIRKIQSNCLWHSSDTSRSIHWVSRKSVFYPKEKGGLGVKDVKILNLALLNKWKWRVINEHEVVWSRLLRGRYVDPVIKVLIGDDSMLNNNDSIWWRDLSLSNNSVSINDNHFTSAISSKVKNGQGTAFWHSKWLGINL